MQINRSRLKNYLFTPENDESVRINSMFAPCLAVNIVFRLVVAKLVLDESGCCCCNRLIVFPVAAVGTD